MAQANQSPSQKRKILFVEPEKLLRDVLKADAERAGFEAVVVSDAGEALREFARHQPDAVVTDLDLPGRRSGADLVRKLRESSLGAVIPIVVVSAGIKTIRSVTDAVIAHDVDDYLAKPVHRERLLWRIGELIEGRPIGVTRADGAQANVGDRPVILERGVDFIQGKLEQADVATLFFSFFATGRSGKLCVLREEDKEVTQVWFQRGYPVFAEANTDGREFSEYLVRAGKLTPEARADLMQEWGKVDRSLGALLVATGMMGARAMFEAMQTNVDGIVAELFAWDRGSFWLEYAPHPSQFDAPDTVSLHKVPTQYVIDGLKQYYGVDRCRTLLQQAQGAMSVARAAHFILRELDDPYYYENLLAQLSQGLTTDELLHRHPFERNPQAMAALLALWVIGGVVELDQSPSVEAQREAQLRKKKAEAIRKAVASAAPSAEDDVRRSRQARIRARLKQRKKGKAAPGGVAGIMASLDKVSSEVAYETGVRQLRAGQYEQAIAALQQAVELAPHNVHYYAPLAQALLAWNRSAANELRYALRVLKKAVQLDPERGDTYHWMGLVLFRMGAREEAKLTLRRAIELGNPHIQESRGLYESL